MKNSTFYTISIIITNTFYTLIILYHITNTNNKQINNISLKNNNKIIKLKYDVKNNFYSTILLVNNDTVVLDFVHPIELEDLVIKLNKQ